MSKSNQSKKTLYVSLVIGIFIIISVGKFFFYDSIGNTIGSFIKTFFK